MGFLIFCYTKYIIKSRKLLDKILSIFMEQKEQYMAIMSEIIAKQAVILGPEIAVLKARNVSGVTIDDKGKVTDITEDSAESLQALISEYIALSGEIVKNVMKPIFEKYPEIRKEVTQ